MWLHNNDWKVLSIMFFVDGYPQVLAFKDHDVGYNLIQVHCCKWRTNIPSPVADQVFLNVVKP